MEGSKKHRKSLFDAKIFSSAVRSANVKLFPEGALGYFIGPTLALLTNSILSGNFNRYMSDVLGMTTWAKDFFNWLPVISVIFVVLGNILVGRLMDHSRSKAGKARPLLLLAIPVCIIALLFLFVFTPFPADRSAGASNIALLVLIAIGYNLWFAVAYPLYFTPHSALVNLSTRNSKDRSFLATISNATALAAMGLCSMVLPFFMNKLFVEKDTEAGKVVDALASFNNWKIFVIALMIITFVGAVIEFLFTRERVTEESFGMQNLETKKATPIGKQAKVCFKDKFWWIILVFFFLYQLGGMVKNVSQTYYCYTMFFDAAKNEYSVTYGGQLQGTLSIIGAVPTALGMVIAWPLSNKIGKGKAILFGAIISTIGGAIGFIAPDNFIVVTVSFVVKALGSTPAMYLSLALLADILDHQEAVHGVRTDGLTMTVYGAIMAGMTGIATGILNVVLSNTGYDPSLGQEGLHNAAIASAMPWVFIGVETICYALIAVLFIFMGVEKFSSIDHKAIVKDQKAKAAEDGVEYVDTATRMAREEEEAKAAAETARIAELKKKCEKNNLNFEEEEAKYQKTAAEKQAAAEAKKRAAEEKKAAALKAKEEKFAALPEEKKAQIARKAELKAKKKAEKDAAILKEFNAIRQKNNQPVLTSEE